MRRIIVLMLAALFVMTACNKASEPEKSSGEATPAKQEKADDPHEMQKAMGRQVAVQWLAFGEEGNWGATWDNAAALFKSTLDKEQWATKAKAARDPLGKLVDRKLLLVRFEESLPGVPDGEYVIAQFNTRWENKAQSVETVSVVKEPDGMWRVTGYFIK